MQSIYNYSWQLNKRNAGDGGIPAQFHAADGAYRHALVGVELLRGLNPGVVQGHRRATSEPSTRTGSLESGIRTLLNQPPLELGQLRRTARFTIALAAAPSPARLPLT